MVEQRVVGAGRGGARAPTVNDVARAAGVSRQTVSNTLNAPERVHHETLRRVRHAIDALGYRPNRMARNLKARTSRLLGYRVPAVMAGELNVVLDAFLHALTDAAREDGYHVVLFTPERGQDEVSAHTELIATGTVDGFVLSETNYGDARVRALIDGRVPFVAFGRSADTAPHAWVDIDGAAGMRAAVEHLLDRGHRRIAFIGWPDGSLQGDERRRGWAHGLEAAGIPADPALDMRGVNAQETGAHGLRQLLDRPDPPTAVVTASDLLAVGVEAAARGRGLVVGRDLGLVGYDDTPVAPLLPTPLTSVRQPMAEAGRHIVRLLTAQLGGSGVASDGVLLTPALVVRESS